MTVLVLLMAATAAGSCLPGPPLGLDAFMPVPESNPLTPEKIALGRQLFFDKRLSRDGTLACATCHDPRRAFSDGRRLARGIGGAAGARNVPAIVNRGYGSSFFWDGRAATLEQQALEPILNPKELGLSILELERRTHLRAPQVAQALASFVRTIRSGGAPFDRYVAGDSAALNPLQQAGLRLFRGKGNCIACHVGPNFTDEGFHNTGVAWRAQRLADQGRGHGAFKTPTLREVARTAPYMHDGSLATLDDVVEFYSEGGRRNPYLDPEIQPRRFTADEKRALVAFLRSLNGKVSEGWR
jgi:cytochrome c peroxidase